MASGSSGRTTNSGSKAFDFASDDILCSYEDYGNRDANTGIHSDPSNGNGTNSTKEFHKNRMVRASVFPSATYNPPEESSFNPDVVSTVENTMKKYTDNLMRFLEGISSRLSQLELYCYNLDKSIGEMRSDFVRDHGESETRLKNLEKHIQEVHRSVQILRDKQELADTQKELAKIQLSHKDSSSAAANTQQNNDSVSTPSEAKTNEVSSDSHDQHLAVVSHQGAPQPVDHQQPPPPPMPSQSMVSGHAAYYLHPPQSSNIPAPSIQPSQTQYLPSLSQMAAPPPQQQSQLNQTPQIHPYPPQWAQQPGQQPVMQPHIRSSNQVIYPNYLPSQLTQSPVEMASNSRPMQGPFMGASQHISAGPEPLPYGYAASAGRPPQTPHVKTGYGGGAQSGDIYGPGPGGPRPSLPQGNAYMMYDSEGGRMHQPHYQHSSFPPTSIPLQNPPNAPNPNIGVPHSARNHPYTELIEKLVNMGYRGEHVVGIIQRLEESGQPIDFNSVLDRLNGHSSGGSQRGWSG